MFSNADWNCLERRTQTFFNAGWCHMTKLWPITYFICNSYE